MTMPTESMRATKSVCMYCLWGSILSVRLNNGLPTDFPSNALFRDLVFERHACKAEVVSSCSLTRSELLDGCAGKREWPAFRDWFAHNLAPALKAWMGDVEVVYEGKEKLDPGSRYVFGYAPHGLFPIGRHKHTILCGTLQQVIILCAAVHPVLLGDQCGIGSPPTCPARLPLSAFPGRLVSVLVQCRWTISAAAAGV